MPVEVLQNPTFEADYDAKGRHLPMSIADLVPSKELWQNSILASSVNSSRVDFAPVRPHESNHLNM